MNRETDGDSVSEFLESLEHSEPAVTAPPAAYKALATFCKPFTKATVRYFDHAKATEARGWLNEA